MMVMMVFDRYTFSESEYVADAFPPFVLGIMHRVKSVLAWVKTSGFGKKFRGTFSDRFMERIKLISITVWRTFITLEGRVVKIYK